MQAATCALLYPNKALWTLVRLPFRLLTSGAGSSSLRGAGVLIAQGVSSFLSPCHQSHRESSTECHTGAVLGGLLLPSQQRLLDEQKAREGRSSVAEGVASSTRVHSLRVATLMAGFPLDLTRLGFIGMPHFGIIKSLQMLPRSSLSS